MEKPIPKMAMVTFKGIIRHFSKILELLSGNQGCGVMVGLFRLQLRAPDQLWLRLQLQLRARYEI